MVRTPMNPDATPELAARHPLGRMEEVDDVVQAIVSGAGILRGGRDPACGRRPERRPLIAAAVA
ncbi:hypothetical protein ACWFR5_17230 [Streptomyces sp. NPDC055092]